MILNKPPLGVPLDWSNPLNDGLRLHLAMNEGHGDKVYDLSGYGNHGTLKNMAFPPTVASGWNPGRNGVALQFDGNNDYIDCGNDESLNITDAITVEAWVNMLYDGYGGNIICKGSDWSSWYFNIQNTSGNLRIYFYDNTGKYYIIKKLLPKNRWVHVVMTYDNTNSYLYYDGIEQSPEIIENGGRLVSNNDDLIIGNSIFHGSINEVRIYNRVLSAAEIRERYINPYGVYLDEDE